MALSRRTVSFICLAVITVVMQVREVKDLTVGVVISHKPRSTVSACSQSQLEAINSTFPDTDGSCSSNKEPWTNACPISKITGCPQTSWLDRYYQRLRRTSDQFVAINIGCNKGFDAVNYLRMGTNDPSVSKARWIEHLPNLIPGVCGQENDEYQLAPGASNQQTARVYCVEPLTATYDALQEAAQQTQYDQQGLTILQYALNNYEPNYTMFPKARNGTGGFEKFGGGDCYIPGRPAREKKRQEWCEPIPTTRLDLLIDQVGLENDQIIDVILIDVEGWDYEVMKGGHNTLRRTAYVEFEYNWRGMWGEIKDDKPLLQAVTMLDEMDFTCYWAGKNQLWRITGCWLKHYEGVFWSNVVCVNRDAAPVLAKSMEDLFLETLGEL